MKKIISIAAIFFLCLTMVSGQVTDKDGKTYKTVSIGTAVWTAENLGVTRFRNGDLIPNVKNKEDWEKASDEQKPAWCYYNFDPSMGQKYGKLYNGYAVLDKRGLAPSGWHVSTDEEWTKLTAFLDEHNAGKKLKADNGWTHDGNGSNESGFSAFPGGQIMYWGNSVGEGNFANFWTSTVVADKIVRTHYYRTIDFSNSLDIYRGGNHSGNGNSVRCVKD